MNKVLTAVALSALALVGLSGAARAECYWAGNHWNCPDGRYVYPKTYPWSTVLSNGVYARPMSPPESDVSGPLTRSAPPQ